MRNKHHMFHNNGKCQYCMILTQLCFDPFWPILLRKLRVYGPFSCPVNYHTYVINLCGVLRYCFRRSLLEILCIKFKIGVYVRCTIAHPCFVEFTHHVQYKVKVTKKLKPRTMCNDLRYPVKKRNKMKLLNDRKHLVSGLLVNQPILGKFLSGMHSQSGILWTEILLLCWPRSHCSIFLSKIHVVSVCIKSPNYIIFTCSEYNTDCPPKKYNQHLGIDCERTLYGIWKIKPDYETMTIFLQFSEDPIRFGQVLTKKYGFF